MLIEFLIATFADSAATADAAHCAPEGELQFVCGISIPEDLVQIPSTPWIIATSMPRDGSAGGLFLIDSRTLEARVIDFNGGAAETFASTSEEAAAVSQCTPLDPQSFLAHGIALHAGENGVHRLYVVGHGGREAIELFNVHTDGSTPRVRWAGCVPTPEHVEANSVIGLPGGGLMFTSLYDAGDTAWPSRMSKLASAAPAGGVYEWHAGRDTTRFGAAQISGPNGIAVSEDGASIYVAGWGDGVVRRFNRSGEETGVPLDLNFLVDNLHWAPDGTLLASGQIDDPQSLFACVGRPTRAPYCGPRWVVSAIDVNTLSLAREWREETQGGFGDSTSAIIVANRLWLGSINGDRIAVAPIEQEGASQ